MITTNNRGVPKVLLVGNFADGTGWSHGIQSYALALRAAGVDTVLRRVKLNSATPNLPEEIREMEQKSSKNADFCIQFLMPHFMQPAPAACFKKTIGLFYTETSDFSRSGWTARANLMDEVWSPSTYGAQTFVRSGITRPIRVVHQPFDFGSLSKQVKPMPEAKSTGGAFRFYTIGEFNQRKNLTVMLTAFHTEFHPNEPVDFMVKTTPPATEAMVREFCSALKDKLRLYPNENQYRRELVNADYVSDNDINRVHASAHCFVGTSYAEGWGLPHFYAWASGKPCILPANTSFLDYATHDSAWLIPCRPQPVIGYMNTLPNMFTAREAWYQSDIAALRTAMREAYESHELRISKTANAVALAHSGRFSFETIGQQMKEALLT